MSATEYVFTAPDTWTPVPEDESRFSEAVDEDIDQGLWRFGYAYMSGQRYDIDIVGNMEIYQRDPGGLGRQARYEYVVLMELPDTGTCFVGIGSVPDLFAFMRLYGSIGRAEVQTIHLEAIKKALDMLFRLYHGHGTLHPCPKCDPDGYRSQQELVREARHV